MTRNKWTTIGLAVLMAGAAVVSLTRSHTAIAAALDSDSAASGHKLAEAWCTTCHAIEADATGARHAGPDFIKVANLPSTTELALKVFLRTSHPSMPNIVLTAKQTDDLVNYILSLKHN